VVLDESQVAEALGDLPGWSGDSTAIQKEFSFKGFKAAVGFVLSIVEPANAARHHPDVDIRYNRVLITLSTHDQGGVTQADVDLAKTIEGLAATAG